VSSSLIRPPGDMRMVPQINDISVVSRIRKSPGRFPLTHKRGNSRVVVLIINPRNDVREVHQSPSLLTQRNKFISAQVLYKQLYIYDPISKKEGKINLFKYVWANFIQYDFFFINDYLLF